MLSVGFWNAKQGIAGYPAIVDFARDVAGDAGLSGPTGETLLCVGEPGTLDAVGLLAALRAADPTRLWWTHTSTSGRFLLAATIDQATFQTYPEGGAALPCLITRTVGGNNETFLVWFVHLAAAVGVGDRNIHTLTTGLALRAAVEATETTAVTGKSILIGDFNMRPYDAGMVAPAALHATPCRTAARRARVISGIARPYFYNPCWELLGNWEATRQPGTFYWLDPTDSVRWHLIDQMLIRPSIANVLRGRIPRILTKVGTNELVTRRGVARRDISDHLPIVASLSI
jgi:endonuclease/exonuclease/phosphatase family metal-dependent hydrolase